MQLVAPFKWLVKVEKSLKDLRVIGLNSLPYFKKLLLYYFFLIEELFTSFILVSGTFYFYCFIMFFERKCVCPSRGGRGEGQSGRESKS